MLSDVLNTYRTVHLWLRIDTKWMKKQPMFSDFSVPFLKHCEQKCFAMPNHATSYHGVRDSCQVALPRPLKPTQSLQKVTAFPNFSSRILATGAKEYLESSLVTLVKATNQWFVKWTNKIRKNSKGRSTMIYCFMLFVAPFLVCPSI